MQNNQESNTHSLSTRLSATLRGLARDERGASFIEYVIVVGLVAMVCIGAFNLLGDAVNLRIGNYTNSLNTNIP